MILHLDYETFSESPIKVVGGYRYSEDWSTEVLMASYAIDDNPVKVWVPGNWGQYFEGADGEYEELCTAMEECDQLWAHNAGFERCITDNVARDLPTVPLEKYRCTAAIAASLGLPRNLAGIPDFLGLDVHKDPKGVALMKKFSMPRVPTKNNPLFRITPLDDLEAFAEYIEYGRQDVVTERAVHEALKAFELSPGELAVWQLDNIMNSRGIHIDLPAVHNLQVIVDRYSKRLIKEFRDITGCNPTQRDKLLEWVNDNCFYMPDLQAKTIDDTLKLGRNKLGDALFMALSIRRSLSRSSTTKLVKMVAAASKKDSRVRGTILYHGAGTGRWSGMIIQPQNFPRGHLSSEEVELALDLATLQDENVIDVIFDDPMRVVSSCLRGVITAPPGKDLIVADYSAIEARIVCWLSGQEDALQRYREDQDAYVDMAAYVFKKAPEEVTSKERKLGKDIVLGCGFSMSWETFMRTCANGGNPIDEKMAQYAVTSFRERYDLVAKYWTTVGRAALRVVQYRKPVTANRVTLFLTNLMGRETALAIRLPSGRCLYYPYPDVFTSSINGRDVVSIDFKSNVRKGKEFLREYTYSGKLVENITQAVARDLMANGMLNAERAGYKMITTIHDELVTEVREGAGDVEKFEKLICQLPDWAAGLPIKAAGYRSKRYKKG